MLRAGGGQPIGSPASDRKAATRSVSDYASQVVRMPPPTVLYGPETAG